MAPVASTPPRSLRAERFKGRQWCDHGQACAPQHALIESLTQKAAACSCIDAFSPAGCPTARREVNIDAMIRGLYIRREAYCETSTRPLRVLRTSLESAPGVPCRSSRLSSVEL